MQEGVDERFSELCDKRAERIHFGQATLIQASLGHNEKRDLTDMFLGRRRRPLAEEALWPRKSILQTMA